MFVIRPKLLFVLSGSKTLGNLVFLLQAKINFLKWYLSVDSSETYGKFRVFRPKKIKKINFSLYYY
jgi:hypothetical protein